MSLASAPLLLDSSRLALVAPGSVGFPRDGARASDDHAWAKYALLDWTDGAGKLYLRSVPYRVTGITEALRELKCPPEIASWLEKA